MRNALALMLVVFCFAGCKSSSSVIDQPNVTSRSIAEMQAEFDRRQAEHEQRCLRASPEQIKSRQAECEKDREEIAPLGNALMEAKIKAAQQSTNR